MTPVSLFARFLFLVTVAQFYAAGLALFGAASFMPHALLGWSFVLLSFALAVAALVSRARKVVAWPAVTIFLLSVAQPAIVFGLRRWPPAAAIHPVVGLVIAGLLITIARRAAEPRIQS